LKALVASDGWRGGRALSDLAQQASASLVVDFCQQPLYIVNMAKGKHPKKEVAEALRYAVINGWTVEQTDAGHRWGVVRCGKGCSISI
jgi:hypothetical protein